MLPLWAVGTQREAPAGRGSLQCQQEPVLRPGMSDGKLSGVGLLWSQVCERSLCRKKNESPEFLRVLVSSSQNLGVHVLQNIMILNLVVGF